MSVENDLEKEESVRVDVWTWATRLFKTRALSGAACKKEQVLVNGRRCRPSRQVRVGDRIEVTRGFLTRQVEVKALLSKRVGAQVVADYLIDHTPPEVYEEAAEKARQARVGSPQRASGSGRPTKRDRRNLEGLMEDALAEQEAFEAFTKRLLKN